MTNPLAICAFALGIIAISSCTSDDYSEIAVELSGAGEECGDDVAIQKKCAPGLSCVFPEDGPESEHTPGTCKALAEEGEECGDDVAIQKKCAPGLSCVFPEDGPESEHSPGTCKVS